MPERPVAWAAMQERLHADDRVRVEEAAARVVALQVWQARVAARQPVPVDVVERARAASADLEAAAY